MTRTEAIAIIVSHANVEVMVELMYLRDGLEHPEYPYDLYSAFEDVVDQVEYSRTAKQSYKQNLRIIGIAIGWYVVVTEEELSKTITLSGGREVKSYDFKHRGLKYRYNNNLVIE